MAGIPTTYYRVCDRCGNLETVLNVDATDYKCSACGHTSGWEFPKYAKAVDMQAQIVARQAS